jgi:polyketide biosynthesis enoyl-CoA hydratase PksI
MSKKVYVTRVEAGVGRIHIDDASHQNRLTDDLIDELMDALRALASDANVDVVILTGRKDVFCGGGTRETLRAVASGNVQVKDLELPVHMVDFPVPIVGALEGHAVGAGLAVGLYCDIVVASSSSRYGLNFTSMGFTPGMGVTGFLPLLVGHGFDDDLEILQGSRARWPRVVHSRRPRR